MLIPFILIAWTTYHDVKLPTTVKFDTREACMNALETLKTKGFDGICLSQRMGK